MIIFLLVFLVTFTYLMYTSKDDMKTHRKEVYKTVINQYYNSDNSKSGDE